MPDALQFSHLSAEDAVSPHGGNRFDVPGAGVLYAATDPQGCFTETLARYRPTAATRAIRAEPGEHLMEVGSVAADWRVRRSLVEFGLEDPLPFLDVDAPETHTYLTEEMAEEFVALGVENIDVAIARGSNRLITRSIASWAFGAVDGSGERRFSGLRYTSRLGDYECWAIFQGVAIIDRVDNAIANDDARLLAVARAFDLTIH